MQEFDVSNHPHRRYNPLTQEWVLVSPHRAKRPWLGQVEKLPEATNPNYDEKCYLCPGNTRVSGDKNPVYQDNFVFTNDFAAMIPDSPMLEDRDVNLQDGSLFKLQPVRGTAKVICFSPDHSKTLPLLEVEQIRKVIDIWAEQFVLIGKEYCYVQLFENKGAIMGCSNPHPHGQIWAGSFIPIEIEKELRGQSAYFKQNKRPLLLDYVQQELQKKERLIFETEYFVALVPFWAIWPFETMLLPKFAVQTIDKLSSEQRDDLACAIKRLTTRYDNLFNCSFPYSMGWHNAPCDGQDHPEWILHAHYYPPLLRSATVKKFVAGYELLAEKQRDLTAEQAADRLRALSETHYLMNN